MTYLIDTCLLVDHLRSVPGATDAFDRALASGRRVTGSVLTRTQLRRSASPSDLAAIETVEILLDWVPVDHEIAATAADLALSYGEAIDTVDYVIAATAQRLGADLLTSEVGRFPMIADLRAAY
jgi:predicted nucleic acid-binding protein